MVVLGDRTSLAAPLSSPKNWAVQLLVPVYNEAENVRVLYNGLRREAIEFDALTFVYDMDGDTTLPVIKELAQADNRINAQKNAYGRGVLNALKWGFSQVSSGPVIVLMADNSDKLSIIPEMIEMWQKGAVIVSPSRYMRGGKQYGGGLIKSTLSRLAGVSLSLIGFPTADATNNFKLYDGEWLKAQQIESVGGFEVALELCYKAFRAKKPINELPTEWRDRTIGKSNFKLISWMPHYLKWYFKSFGLIAKRICFFKT